eukprot:TRINITY_DN19377_c0_g1_i1.p1 TRINITY_DN19377_c0_g1~~TRINITY_DN19377_c0_g1_i1.p1  ORF type:complete len:458 (+),score=143.37 TRINITY_DN19377_c0_g1_i1:41-1414(+)
MPPKAAGKAKSAAGKAKAKAKAPAEPKAKAKAAAAPPTESAPAAEADAAASAPGAAAAADPASGEGAEAPKTPAGSGVAAARALASASEPAGASPPEAVAAKEASDANKAEKKDETSQEAKAPEAKKPEPEQAKSDEAPAEPTPALAAATPAERAKRLQSGADPWKGVSCEEALRKIDEEDWEVIDLNGDEADQDAAKALAAGKGAHAGAKEDGRESLAVSEAVEKVTVSLDISECAFVRVDALPALWLRNLALNGNPLTSLEGLCDLFPQLVAIDLSFVDLSSVDGAFAALRRCPQLRSLTAEAAGISTFEDFEHMPQLTCLEIVENEVEELDELKVLLEKCPSLKKLDLRENPIVTESGYAAKVKKVFPKLEWHNNQSGKKYIAATRDKVGYSSSPADGDVAAVDGLFKNESCSCVEGNPCLDRTTCRDWENRHKVAAEARKTKGLRDDTGKLCT